MVFLVTKEMIGNPFSFYKFREANAEKSRGFPKFFFYFTTRQNPTDSV